MSERVRVVVRIRPFIASDPPDADLNTIVLDPTHVSVGDRRVFTADRVFMMEDSSEEVYDEVVAPLVERFINGCNASVLAYGQTGTGKTYTVQSILPLLLTQVLSSPVLSGGVDGETGSTNNVLSRLKRQPLLRLQYVEVYGEVIRDLLDDSKAQQDPHNPPKLRLVTTNTNNFSLPSAQPQCSVVGATIVPVYSIREAAALISSGDARRATGATNVHERSSRSHAILTLFHPRYACRFDVVDLAGSEREKKTGNTGLRFQESIAINTGLLALGNVIRALSRNHRSANANGAQRVAPPFLTHTQSPAREDGDAGAVTATNTTASTTRHVPYRSSKLTRLLQDTLGGSSATLFVACVAPDTYNRDETLRTLQYCSLALQVLNVPVRQLERLQRAQSRERGGRKDLTGQSPAAPTADAEENLKEVRVAYAELQQHYDEQAEVLASVCESYAAAKEQLEVWEGELRSDADLFARQTRLVQRLVKENRALRHRLKTSTMKPAVGRELRQAEEAEAAWGGDAREEGQPHHEGGEAMVGSGEDPVRALLQRLLKEQHNTEDGREDVAGADTSASAVRDGVDFPPLQSARSPHRHLSFRSSSSMLQGAVNEEARFGIGNESPHYIGGGGGASSRLPSVPIQSYIQSLLRQHGIVIDKAAGAARPVSPLDASPVVNVAATPAASRGAATPSLHPLLPNVKASENVRATPTPQQTPPSDLQLLQLASEVLRYEEANTDLRNKVRLLQVKLDDKTREAARLRLEVQDMKDVYSSLSAMTE